MTLLQRYMDRIARSPDDGAGAGAGGSGAGTGGDNNGGGGGAQKPWYDGKADAETIGHWENKGWKKDDPIAIALEASKAARELQKHFGVPADQIIKLPKDAGDAAAWKAVHQRLGAPGEAKDYDLSTIKVDGAELDAAFTDKMRAALFDAGVAKDKAPSIVKVMADQREAEIRAGNDAAAARLQTERGDLQKEWGTNFEFNRLTAMQGARRAVGTDEAAAKVVEAMQGALGYKATMEFWRKIGAGTTEDSFVNPDNGTSPTTRNGALARLAELRADTAWGERLMKGDVNAKREFDNLMQLAHGAAA